MTADKSSNQEALLAELQRLKEENKRLSEQSAFAARRLKKAEEKLTGTQIKLKESNSLLKKERGLTKRQQTLLEKETQRAEQERQRADEEKQRADENEAIIKKNAFLEANVCDLISQITEEAQSLIGAPNAVLSQRLATAITELADAYRSLAQRRDDLLQRIFKKGHSESIPVPSQQELDEKKANLISTSLVNHQKELGRLLSVTDKLLKENEWDSPESKTRAAMKEIASVEVPSEPKPEKQKSKGRQVRQADIEKKAVLYTAQAQEECAACGSSKLTTLGEMAETIRSDHAKLTEHYSFIESHSDLQICTKCGRAHVVLPEGCDHPALPGRSIGIHSIIEAAYWLSNGVPLQKISSPMKQVFKLGHSTIYYQLQDLDKIYLQPLLEAIEEQAREEKVLLADETVFPVLEYQGKGNTGTRKVTEPKSTNYLLALGSSRDSQCPFALYYPMRGRDLESIKEHLTKDYNFEYLVSDAYSAYNSIIKSDHPQAKRQSCLVHFRREVLRAVLTDRQLDEIGKLELEEQEQMLKTLISNDSSQTACLMVVEAIGKVIRLREKRKELSGRERRENEENQKLLMDQVDTIMNQLKENRVEMKRSVWSSLMQSDRTASACCYYLNNKEELRTFLANPAVPCDSNLIENSIRPAAVIRKNLQCLQTIKSAESVFDILSVYRTLQLNKVEDPQEFLRCYCRSLYLYMVENAWTAALKDGKDPAKKIKSYDFKELRKGFDVSSWLPWKANLTKK